jgi:hypothetical protein
VQNFGEFSRNRLIFLPHQKIQASAAVGHPMGSNARRGSLRVSDKADLNRINTIDEKGELQMSFRSYVRVPIYGSDGELLQNLPSSGSFITQTARSNASPPSLKKSHNSSGIQAANWPVHCISISIQQRPA